MASQAKARITGFVFFILSVDAGRVRVGYSANPREQLRTFQTASPDPLTLSLVFPGTIETHRAIEAKLAGCHVANGWHDTAKVAGILLGLAYPAEADNP